MSKYEYTIHASQKFTLSHIRKLGITKSKVQQVIENPQALDKSEDPVYIAIGKLNSDLSLCVAYRKVKGKLRIITFYPAEKGRYERKILSRR